MYLMKLKNTESIIHWDCN